MQQLPHPVCRLFYARAVGAEHRIARTRTALGWRPTDRCVSRVGRAPRAQASDIASRRLLANDRGSV